MRYTVFAAKICVLLVILTNLSACQNTTDNMTYLAPPPPQPEKVESDPIWKIIIADEKELSGLYEVDDSGNIIMPLIGKLYVQDKTAQEIEYMVKTALQNGYILAPIVSVKKVKKPEHYRRDINTLHMRGATQ